jgi:hypothetical protein
MLAWGPDFFSWRALWPYAVALLFMGGLIAEVERLEHQQMARLGECRSQP